MKFGHLSWSFLVGFYLVTKSGHLSWSFILLKKTAVTKNFGLVVTNLLFSTSAHMLSVDVIVTSECIHLYFLCIVTRCLFWDLFVISLGHVIP